MHSDLSNDDKNELIENLNQLIKSTHQQIIASTHIIITYGTSWVYRNKTTNQVVTNCHKVPQNQFDKELLSIKNIKKSIRKTIDLTRKLNPNCKFIFTISPVRHIKDGFIENNVSKAHLISAIHQILDLQLLNTNYFPSFEIMMDELRDYRFYAEDMLHPSQTAIDYIWIKFFENYVYESEFLVMQQVCDIQKALHHRPFHPKSESHEKFLENLNQKINTLVKKYPQIQF